MEQDGKTIIIAGFILMAAGLVVYFAGNEAPCCKQTGYLYWIFLFIALRGGVLACLRISLAMAGRFTLAPASGGIACLPSPGPGYGRQVRLENFITPPQLW